MPKATTRPSSRQDERVMVFIDGSNLYHVLGQTCGRHDLQFDKFAQKLANGRDLRRVYYYNIRQEAFEDRSNAADQDKFLSSLYDTPHLEVKLGIWKQRGSTMVEKGVDVMLAVDLVTHAYKDHYDTAIMVSGDADFYPALQAAKDVGKQVEVAAFETNISSEAARVADLHLKLTKTYFTGLWMTRAQLRKRNAALRKPEVTDEAASPNGEDKAATKAATKPSTRRTTRSTRASSTRASSTRSSSTRANTTTRRRTSTRSRSAEPVEAPEQESVESTAVAETPVEETPTTERSNIRRTPARRRIGGASAASSSNGSNGSRIRPPALRTPSSSTNGSSESDSSSEASEAEPAETT